MEEKVFFSSRRADETTTKTNNKMAHIIKNFYNDLYGCEDRREFKLYDQRENLTETGDIIPMMTDEVLLAIIPMKKVNALQKCN